MQFYRQALLNSGLSTRKSVNLLTYQPFNLSTNPMAQDLYYYHKHIAMENREIREQWPEMKGKIMKQYPHLTEEELKYEIGKEAELLERLKEKLGKNWQEIKNTLSIMG